MPEPLRTYHGNCHCGGFRFEIETSEITKATACDCSLCAKKGYLWFKPESDVFTITRDGDLLTQYESKTLRDQFCSVCGTGVLGEHSKGPLKDQLLVNLRAVQGVNPFKLSRSETQQSEAEPREIDPLPVERDAAPALHAGSCHCGKVRVELLVPLSESKAKEDNCSSCVRDAYIGVYPNKDQVRIHGRENTFEYLYGRKFNGIAHCKTCGVAVFNNVYGPPISVFDTLPPERKEKVLEVYWKNMALQPLNVRALDGIDLESVDIERTDEETEGYVLPE